MASMYPAVARQLLHACGEYRQHRIDLTSLKASTWSAASQILIPQEKAFRDYLQQAEGRLDMLEFTTDDDKLLDATLELVEELEIRLRRYLGEDAER